MAGYGYTAIHTEHARHMLHAVWTVICWICDTVIFILAGAIIVQEGFLANKVLLAPSLLASCPPSPHTPLLLRLSCSVTQ